MENGAKAEYFSSRFYKSICIGRNSVLCGSSPDNIAFQMINNGTFLDINCT